MPLAATEVPAAPIVIFMALGVVLALVGHMSRSRTLVVAGLTILFMATAAMVVGAYVAYEGGETDPREERDPRDPTL
jgi:hypothetical protein